MNMFKMLGMLRNAGQMQQDLQAELGKIKVDGAAGGDMVSVTVNGQLHALSCRIDPSLMEDNDREMIEELLVSAMNDAVEKAKRIAAETTQAYMSEKMNMPELNGLIGNFLNPGNSGGPGGPASPGK